MTTVERRARMHAALGDEVRLAIVDRLAPGDASPGELADRFGLASNLMAHHLRVLETAGVIRRIRSEGDRRRSYVQLCLEDPLVAAAVGAGAPSGPAMTVPRVLFVCTANSARSQLAAASWARISPVPAASAGTRPAAAVHPRAVAIGRRHGLHLGRTGISIDEVWHHDDLVVVVCDSAHEELGPHRDRLHWAVRDPVRLDTDDAFETAYDDINRRVSRLAAALSNTA